MPRARGSRATAAALNAGRFQVAIEELEALIESGATEPKVQAHLERQPWMFGSEYSELF